MIQVESHILVRFQVERFAISIAIQLSTGLVLAVILLG
jgi:hypothetical protein